MEPRNWIGLVFIVAGVILQPIGWMFVFWLQVLSFALLFIGIFIFVTQKFIEKSEEKEFRSSGKGGPAMPGDVHDYSGWGKAGRSESYMSESGGDGGGGGD